MVVKCKHYAFTIFAGQLNNKFTNLQEWFDYAKDRTSGVKYLVYQLEVAPTTKQIHVQGFVTWQVTKTPASTANHFGGIMPECFQKMKKGSTPWSNKVYCTKDSDRLEGSAFFEYGETPEPNGKDDPDKSKLDIFIDMMKVSSLSKAIEEMPSTFVRNCNGLAKLDQIYAAARIPVVREVNVLVAYGPPGSGKSWFAQTYDTPENTFAIPDIRHKERLNLDGYAGQRTLLIEDYDGAIDFRSLLRMLDVYKAQFNTKGATVWSAWDTVIITSNVFPGRWYDDQIDPWGLQDQSPLRRRITTMLEFKGKWPMSTVVVDGQECSVSMLPNREEWEQHKEQNQQKQESEQDDTYVPSQKMNFGFTEEELGLAPQPAAAIEGLTAEELEQEWDEEDEARANDFLATYGPSSPLVFEHDPEAEGFLLEGELGDGLRDNGRIL